MKLDYNAVMDAMIAYFNNLFADPYSGLDITFGRSEPQPENYNRAYVKMGYGDKRDETGKYGTNPAMEVNWNIQMIICCNEAYYEDSEIEAWDVLSEIEEFIRADITLGGDISYLMKATPGDARGGHHEGTEYRLTMELLTRWQIH